MEFGWTKEQLAFRKEVVEFAQRHLNDDVITRDLNGEFNRDFWKKCGEFGIQGLAMPTEYGGKGANLTTVVLAMEALGYGCRDNGLTFGMNAQMWSVQQSIANFGSDDQKKKYIPPLCRGDIIAAHSITEPDSGSDLYSLKTRAEKRDGGYVLNGKKILSTWAPIADVALVFGTIDPKLGQWGLTAFLIDKGTKGFHPSPVQQKMGLRTIPIGEIALEDCFVPVSARVGKEGAGVSISNSSLEWDRSCILASQIGAMERQLEETIAYAKERHQFGQPIGKFQSVANRIAEMKVRLESSRLLLYKVAWIKDQGRSALMEAAMAKYYVGECYVQSSLDAIRVRGGRGYLTEHGVERDLRDSIGGTLAAGTADMQRNVVARMLGL